jgi:hypothetical protein
VVHCRSGYVRASGDQPDGAGDVLLPRVAAQNVDPTTLRDFQALYLLCWAEATQVQFVPECLCFIFKCADDYHRSPDWQSPQRSCPRRTLPPRGRCAPTSSGSPTSILRPYAVQFVPECPCFIFSNAPMTTTALLIVRARSDPVPEGLYLRAVIKPLSLHT